MDTHVVLNEEPEVFNSSILEEHDDNSRSSNIQLYFSRSYQHRMVKVRDNLNIS